jgi:hypothetical protein
MRPVAILLAVLGGSVLSVATAQFSSSAPTRPSSSPMLSLHLGGGNPRAGGSDDCATPDLIAGTGSFPFDNSAATQGTEGQNESLCYDFGTTAVVNDVWFEWTSDFTGACQVDTCGSTVDTKIAAYPGGGCPVDGSSLVCNDDECAIQSKITFPVITGQSYMIQVGTFPTASGGAGLLNIKPVPVAQCPTMHDASSENSIGLTAGGETCFLYYVDCMATIESVEVVYGTPAYPGLIAAGSPVTIAIWDDPTDDADPSDAVLLALTPILNGVTLEDTDTFNVYPHGNLTVSGGTFIGAIVTHAAGEYPASLDMNRPSFGRNWIVGMTAGSGLPFDFYNLAANDAPPVDIASAGYDGAWMLQVTGQEVEATIGKDPGVGYCFGDPGSGTPCPCSNDNDGSVPGSGCDNGVFASGAKLSGSGLASLSDDTLVLSASHLEPNNSGLYFQANNNLDPGNPWGDGLQCAGGGLRRLGVRFADATGNSDTSSWSISISQKAGNIMVGDLMRYQCWYRTTVNPPCGSGVNEFNSTNGYEVIWLP